LAIHYRPLIARALAVLLIAASIGLLIASRNPNSFAHNAEATLADALAPVIDVIAKPIDSMSAFGNWLHEWTTLREENRELKAENSRLQEWYSATLQLKSENEKLRALLKFAPAGKPAYISARVAVDSANSYSRSLLITAGAENGVQDDSVVINDQGVVGHIIDVGKKTSRVLLLSDINSRIPVMAEGSLEHAVAAGGSGDLLTLMYLPENSKLAVGDKIVTSGDGALIPPGLPVGVVSKIENGVVTVKPFADWYRLEYVSVLNF
jgi:rod shape-determining protein MreC